MSRNHGAVSCVATRFEHCGRILFFMCASTVVDELSYLSSLSASFFFFFSFCCCSYIQRCAPSMHAMDTNQVESYYGEDALRCILGYSFLVFFVVV